MSIIDYCVIAVYMIGIVAVGLLSKGKGDSTEEYFAAGGRMSGMLGTIIVGLSITATFFSGLSFVAVPSIVISDGPKVMLIMLTLPLVMVFVCHWFLPRYLAFGSLHPYEIITRHIGPKAHHVTAALFVLLRLGWMSALLYAPTILLLTTMQLGPEWFWPLILGMGLTSTLYTVVGGLQSVLITDAVQMLIVIGSLIVAVVFGLMQLPPAPGHWMEVLSDQGKLTAPALGLDLTQRFTLLGIFVAVTFANLGNYVGDQMSLQRYIAMNNLRDAQRSFKVNMYGTVLTLALLFLLGFIIVIWHSHQSDAGPIENADIIFPQFVATVLPPGLCGLMVAAILAATMDSVASGINALAGSITVDFIQPRARHASPERLVKIGKGISLAIGVGATFGAGAFEHLDSIYDRSQMILGVFMGPILAVVLLATLNAAAGERRVLGGILAGLAAGLAVAFSPIQSIWVCFFGFLATFVIGLRWDRKRPSSTAAASLPHEQ